MPSCQSWPPVTCPSQRKRSLCTHNTPSLLSPGHFWNVFLTLKHSQRPCEAQFGLGRCRTLLSLPLLLSHTSTGPC